MDDFPKISEEEQMMFPSYRNTSKYTFKGLYVTTAMVIFSLLKITCYFHVRGYHVDARKLTRYFSGFI